MLAGRKTNITGMAQTQHRAQRVQGRRFPEDARAYESRSSRERDGTHQAKMVKPEARPRPRVPVPVQRRLLICILTQARYSRRFAHNRLSIPSPGYSLHPYAYAGDATKDSPGADAQGRPLS